MTYNMSIFIKVFLITLTFIMYLFLIPFFGGGKYCFPGAVDNGPGSAWCIYTN